MRFSRVRVFGLILDGRFFKTTKICEILRVITQKALSSLIIPANVTYLKNYIVKKYIAISQGSQTYSKTTFCIFSMPFQC